MKTLRYTTLIVLLLAAFSCDSLLDIEADGTISGDVLSNDAAIEDALLGAYYSFGGIADGTDGGELLGGDFTIIATLLGRANGQEVFWSSATGPAYANFIDKDIINTNTRVSANWRRGYEVINAVNNILANIDNVSAASDQDRIRGEALAMRGILYFEMVRLWAPQYDADGVSPASTPAIPIVSTPITDVSEITTPTISTIEQVYEQASNDLMEASNLLQAFGTNGTRLSYYACQAYLARMAMQQNDYFDATLYLNEVITSGAYTLVSSPMAAFNNSVNSTEDIFAIQQTLSNTAGDRSTGTGLVNFLSPLTESGLGTMAIIRSSVFGDLPFNSPRYEDADLRGSVDVEVDASTTAAQVSTAFIKNIPNNNDDLLSTTKYLRGDHVLPVIRLAEMYLSRAEALYEIDRSTINATALEDLNLIRVRAGLNALAATDFADPAAFLDSIKVERTRELIYEGHLLHDLRRWGEFVGTPFGLSDPWGDNFVLPIPQAETDTGTGG